MTTWSVYISYTDDTRFTNNIFVLEAVALCNGCLSSLLRIYLYLYGVSRLKLNEAKSDVVKRLKEATQLTTHLESHLKR